MGFCITLFGGWFLSWIFECCGLAGDKVIFLDGEKKIFNVDLFSPPIAKRLQRENAKYLENNFTVSCEFIRNLLMTQLTRQLIQKINTFR